MKIEELEKHQWGGVYVACIIPVFSDPARWRSQRHDGAYAYLAAGWTPDGPAVQRIDADAARRLIAQLDEVEAIVSADPDKAAEIIMQYLQTHDVWCVCACPVETTETEQAYEGELDDGTVIYYDRDAIAHAPPGLEDAAVNLAANGGVTCRRCGEVMTGYIWV